MSLRMGDDPALSYRQYEAIRELVLAARFALDGSSHFGSAWEFDHEIDGEAAADRLEKALVPFAGVPE